MPRCITLTPTKTYATEANAIKAVEKRYPSTLLNANLTYIICRTDGGRFYPVFIGERAVQAGAHFHFCVVN